MRRSASHDELSMFRSRKVCIVGGGPAGLVAAIALRRADFDVTVVDCAVPPIDKACGEGLMPDSISVLRQIGIEIPTTLGCEFHGVRFKDIRSSVSADFPDGVARGLRRTVLHEFLIQQANTLGISMVWNAKQVGLVSGGVSQRGEFIEAQFVIGADGQNSQIRRQAGLEQITSEKRRYGFRRHYRIASWSSYMELHWGRSSQVYVTPIARDEVCVASISGDPRQRLEQALCEVPELKRRLHDAAPLSPEMGALSVSRTLKSVQCNGVALIGDASGSVDAITGEGMCLAFHQAVALVDGLKSGDLRRYQRAHRALMQRPLQMASLMLTLERNDGLQRRALAGLAQHPEIFELLLAIHMGAARFRDLWSLRLFDFGRAFLSA